MGEDPRFLDCAPRARNDREGGVTVPVLMFNDYVRVKCSMEMSVHERTEDSDSELMPLNGVGESDPILWWGRTV